MVLCGNLWLPTYGAFLPHIQMTTMKLSLTETNKSQFNDTSLIALKTGRGLLAPLMGQTAWRQKPNLTWHLPVNDREFPGPL